MLLKLKSDAFEAFKRYKTYAEARFGRKLLSLQDDKGGEYMSNEFNSFCSEHGIHRRHSTRNIPQQNGVAERANRTLEEHCTAMLFQANLPASFLGDCALAYVYTWNMMPSRALKDSTPHCEWYGSVPDVSRIRVFGALSYVHIQRDKRTGIGSHMERCIFVGYPEGYKAWRFYNPLTHKFIISERAEFDERYFPGLSMSPQRLPSIPPA